MIYLDNNATTPLDPRVLEAMMPYFCDEYGNSSSSHFFGQRAKESLQVAREQVAALTGAAPGDLLFTSGSTEGINLALKGYAFANRDKGNHIITVETEHKAVLDTCKYLEKCGFGVTYLPVNTEGLIDIDQLKAAITQDTLMIAVMYVNNETGVIQPVETIGAIAREHNVPFLCDATQAVGKIPVSVNACNMGMMALSAHKFYGPKGVGCLYVRGLAVNKVKLESLIHGGGQEHGLRSGTHNVPGIVGLGKACELLTSEMEQNRKHITPLRDKLENELLKTQGAKLNGSKTQRIFNVSNLCLPSMDFSRFADEIVVSAGSACNTGLAKPSFVLKAMGLSDEDAMRSVRISWGKGNGDLKIWRFGDELAQN